MKIVSVISFVLISCICVFAQKGNKYVQPTSGEVGVYANETRSVNENAIARVGVEDRLLILDTKREHYKVKTPAGVVGWVEKRLVASASGKNYMFSDAEVIGYLDNPTPVYIIDADNKDAAPIKLERSFADALKENVDREQLFRIGVPK